MPKELLEQRALMVIEKLLTHQNPDETDEFLNQLYAIAHGCNRTHSCHHVHKDWVERMVVREKELKDA